MLSETRKPPWQKLALLGEGAGCPYSPTFQEEAFSDTHIHDPAWIASVEAADTPIRPSVENCQPQHVVGKNKDARSWRRPAE
jgi:hypothetical protein